MKLIHLHFSRRRSSIARLAFTTGACVAAAALSFAAPAPHAAKPITAKLAGAAVPTGPGTAPASMSKRVQVMIELDAPAAARIYAEALQAAQAQADAKNQSTRRAPLTTAEKGKLPRVEVDAAGTARVQNHLAMLNAQQQALLPAIANTGAAVTYRTQRAYNGIAVRVSPDKVAELAKLPGVKAVRPMTLQYPTAFNDIDFLGGRSFWTKVTANRTGYHGEGVKIAVIDTGLDYVHTNFGGPGTAAAYAATTDTKSGAPYFPSAKVPFGYDFAGDDYNANNDPHPDGNPMDTNGHGTACASVAAGFGVNYGGTTYQGNYDAAAPDISSLKISPGFAPAAQIVPLRVFGTSGGTYLATEAIDYAMDPNGDGNFNDHVDVISMSLGSQNGSPDDDSAIAASNAVAAGVLVVCSAGNDYDTYYITGGASSAPGAISTAASFNDQAGFIADANVTINKPSAYAGSKQLAIYGNPSPRVGPKGMNGNVVEARPADAGASNGDGSTNDAPLDNAQYMQGKICLVNRGSSTFYQKALRAQKSGAKAVIIVNQNHPNEDPIVAGLNVPAGENGPQISIPVVMIARTDAVDAYRANCDFDPQTGVPNNPEGSNVTIFNDNQVVSHGGAAPDTMTNYSSRGPQLNTNALKPDVTAPGEVVGVAATKTGSGVKLHNGTSSACPHVSGGIAVAKQLHPTWSVKELNALIMNTAVHDLYLDKTYSTKCGVSRVGAGRVDFDLASKSDVIIFNAEDTPVSVSYGNVEVPVNGQTAITKNVTIRNKGDNDITYDASIQMLNTVGDANFSAPQSSFTVAAHSQVTFPVLLRATGNTLKKTRDPSVSSVQDVASAGNFPRDWIAEAAGYGVLTPSAAGPGATTLRIPLHAIVKPVSSMHAVTNTFTPSGANGSFAIQLDGAPINTGGSASTGGILSRVKALELQYTSPLAGSPNAPNDVDIVKYVGITSDYPSISGDKSSATITFGIDAFGNGTLPNYRSSDKEIFIDLNFDGDPDFVLYPSSLIITNSNPAAHSNVYYTILQNLHTGDTLYEYPTNGVFPALAGSGSFDINAFNNSAISLSVDARDLGYTGAGQSNFNYWVTSFDPNTGAEKARTATMKYDLAKPGFNVENGNFEPFYYIDYPGTGQNITVHYDGSNIKANQSQGVLLIHRHNATGQRSEVVTLTTPKIGSFTPDHGPVGTNVTVRGQNFDSHTVVRFAPNVVAETNVLSATTLVARVPQGAKTGKITVSNGVGSDKSANPFTVTAQ